MLYNQILQEGNVFDLKYFIHPKNVSFEYGDLDLIRKWFGFFVKWKMCERSHG